MTQFANFVELFSRKGFHLRQWDRRKFCFDFVGLLLQKFGSKSAAMDILLVLIRNSSVEGYKPACFRSVFGFGFGFVVCFVLRVYFVFPNLSKG